MLRKILLALALLLVVLVGVGIYFFHRLDSEFARDSLEEQKKLEPRVIIGGGRFDKTMFYSGANLGEITQIQAGWPADREGATITVVGNQGAHFLDVSAGLKKQIHFSKNIGCSVEVARLDANGDYGFMTRDQSWSNNVILFDNQGRERWSYPGGFQGVDDSVGGDVDGDGNLEVVISFNGSSGIALLNREGKKVWQKTEANVWHVETLDTKGDGRKEILHSNARGQLLVRNASGEVIARYLPGYYVSHFALTRWGGELEASHILIPTKEAGNGCCKPVLLVLDAKGATIAHLDAPLSDLMHGAKGTPVHYAKNVEYYAVLQTRRALERSVLSLYDNEGQIAYQEILGESCLGIATLPGKLGDGLLIGCSGKIWKYSPAARGQASGTVKERQPLSSGRGSE